MPAHTPNERALVARIASHTSWANTRDRSQRTEAARRAFRDRFIEQVPADITDPAQRAVAAESLRRAHYAQLALKSSQSRRRAREATAAADAADAELHALSHEDGGAPA